MPRPAPEPDPVDPVLAAYRAAFPHDVDDVGDRPPCDLDDLLEADLA